MLYVVNVEYVDMVKKIFFFVSNKQINESMVKQVGDK